MAEVALEDGINSKPNEIDTVKFTKANDDVDMAQPTTKLIGLTKEQLELYRNDPFWKTVRYGLFILFWLVWLAMFVGAILIVILSPKCAAKIEPKWHENAVAYQIFTPTFKDTDDDGVGDLKGIKEQLNELRKIGVSAIWPTPLVTTDKDVYSPEAVTEIFTTDPRFGTDDDLATLIDAAHKMSIQFIVDLPLTISVTGDNWLKGRNFTIGTAGKSKALLLDIGNEWVQDNLINVAKKFLKLGVDGLFLADYGLFSTAPETIAKSLKDFINRLRTTISSDVEMKQNEVLIFTNGNKSFNQRQSVSTENYHIVSLLERTSEPIPLFDRIATKIQDGLKIIKTNDTIRPIWQLGDLSGQRIDQFIENVSPDDQQLKTHKFEISSLLTMLQLFLPGPSSILYGEELALPSAEKSLKQPAHLIIQQWSKDERNLGFSPIDAQLFFPTAKDAQNLTFKEEFFDSTSPLKAFKRMTDLRKKDVLLQGDLRYQKTDDNLYVYVRFISYAQTDEPIYILIVNPQNESKRLLLDRLKSFMGGKVPAKIEVKVPSAFNNKQSLNQELKLTDFLALEPFTGVVLSVQ